MEYDFDAIDDEDSPYPEVRASVSNIDDPEMPARESRVLIAPSLLVNPLSSHIPDVGDRPSPVRGCIWDERLFQFPESRPYCYSSSPSVRPSEPFVPFPHLHRRTGYSHILRANLLRICFRLPHIVYHSLRALVGLCI